VGDAALEELKETCKTAECESEITNVTVGETWSDWSGTETIFWIPAQRRRRRRSTRRCRKTVNSSYRMLRLWVITDLDDSIEVSESFGDNLSVCDLDTAARGTIILESTR
jgi:hypothetical protein